MKILRRVGIPALLVFSVVFPLVFSDAVATTIAIFTLIIMAAATGWNLFSGYTRYLSLGHATFYGLGAYIFGEVCQIGHIQGGVLPLLLLPIVGLMTGLCALPLGWIALRTRRFIFMVITLTIFALVSLLPSFFPQTSTLYMPLPPWSSDIFNIPFYYAALVLLFCALLVAWWIRSSKFGLCLLAIGDDEDRALGLGNKIGLYKLIAWIISALFVGMAGALNAYYVGVLDPGSAFTRSINIALPVTVFIGGIGTLTGPLIGALFTVPLQQLLLLQSGNIQGLDLILYGVLLLVVILVLPQGIVPVLQKHILAAAQRFKGAGRVQTLITNDILGTPALATQSAFSYESARDDISSVLELETTVRSSNSVPLSIKRGYGSIKHSRLVPLSNESTDDSGSLRKFDDPPTTGSFKVARLVPLSQQSVEDPSTGALKQFGATQQGLKR